MHGPLQARSARVSGPVSQAPRPHGGSFPGSSLGTAPYETVSLVDEVPGYSSLLAVPSPTKSVRHLFLCPFSVAGPQFSPERSTYGGNLPSPNDNDGCFPLEMGSSFRGTAGLWCLVRQVPHLAHKRPGVESGSSSFHSRSSVSDALTSHRQEGQHGGDVSHQSPGRLPVTHPEQACAQQLLLWAQDKLLSPRAVHVPEVLNLAADFLSRQKLSSGEWMLNRRTVAQIWERFDVAEVDLFVLQG